MSDISPLETICNKLEVIKCNGMGLKKATEILKTAYFLKEHTLSTQENSKYLSKLEVLFDEIYDLCSKKMNYLISHKLDEQTAKDTLEFAWIIGEKTEKNANPKIKEINELVNNYTENMYTDNESLMYENEIMRNDETNISAIASLKSLISENI